MFPMLWILAAIVLDIFALTDIMNSNRDTFSKIVLIVLIVLFPVFAAGIYLLIFRDKSRSF
ncbi:MAG TPA: PLDc N-terminal domain-containing protein [Blastocatellia bacterium]|nr:PLDc N-terminal domain-containing protein [Blastocatellia bacterium]